MVNGAHVHRGESQCDDEIHHGYGHLRMLVWIEKEEIVYRSYETVPREQESGTGEEESDVHQAEAVFGIRGA